MNVECQTIRVPTGVQDYRPALYGGIAAIELGVDGIRRSALDVDPRELERRIVLAYTGRRAIRAPTTGKSRSGTSTATAHIFDCFERIRDTAVAMRTALERATGTRSASRSPSNGTTASGWRLESRRRQSRT